MTGSRTRRSPRAQANLLALVAALIALVAATTLGLALADAAFAGADRPVDERRVALALSERVVSPESPLSTRANVLDGSAVARLNSSQLAAAFPVVDSRPVRVRLDGRTVVERGDVTGGATVRRIVLVSERTRETLTPSFDDRTEPSVSLPRRTSTVELRIDPPNETTVERVRVNGRVVLAEPSGLDGTYTVAVSRFETARLSFETSGTLPEGSVRVTYVPAETEKSVLEVSVGAD